MHLKLLIESLQLLQYFSQLVQTERERERERGEGGRGGEGEGGREGE